MRDDVIETAALTDALLALGRARHREDEVAAELGLVLDLLQKHPDVRRFLADPAVLARGKWEALEELLAGAVSPDVFHFVMILAQNGDTVLLERIVKDVYERVSRQHEKMSGRLISAYPVDPVTVDRIQGELGRILGTDVTLHVQVDESLVGGFRVEVGSFVMDSTIDRQLESIRKLLMN